MLIVLEVWLINKVGIRRRTVFWDTTMNTASSVFSINISSEHMEVVLFQIFFS